MHVPFLYRVLIEAQSASYRLKVLAFTSHIEDSGKARESSEKVEREFV